MAKKAASPRGKKFRAALEAVGPSGGWTKIQIPFDVHTAWGTRGRLAVCGSINGFQFRTSIFPNGDGTHHMMVNRAMRDGASAKQGDAVWVELAPDTAPRAVKVPEDLETALAASPRAEAAFSKLAASHQREFVEWIERAKKPATRSARIAKTIERLRSGGRT